MTNLPDYSQTADAIALRPFEVLVEVRDALPNPEVASIRQVLQNECVSACVQAAAVVGDVSGGMTRRDALRNAPPRRHQMLCFCTSSSVLHARRAAHAVSVYKSQTKQMSYDYTELGQKPEAEGRPCPPMRQPGSAQRFPRSEL